MKKWPILRRLKSYENLVTYDKETENDPFLHKQENV